MAKKTSFKEPRGKKDSNKDKKIRECSKAIFQPHSQGAETDFNLLVGGDTQQRQGDLRFDFAG